MPTHPLWKTLHAAVVLTCLGGILALNAERFDQTELLSLLEFGAVLAGAEWWRKRGRAGE